MFLTYFGILVGVGCGKLLALVSGPKITAFRPFVLWLQLLITKFGLGPKNNSLWVFVLLGSVITYGGGGGRAPV